MAGYGIITVNLQRDGFSTPWGFRLSGGKDFKTPLIVTKVVVGSPADSELRAGDVVLNLENYETRNMLHKKAQEIIKNCGSEMLLKVDRTGSGYSAPSRNSIASPVQGYLSRSGEVNQGYRTRPLDGSSVGVVGFIPKLESPASPPSQASFGMDFSAVSPRPAGGNATQGFMINKISNSLSNAIWSPGQAPSQPEPPRAVRGLVNNDSVIRQSKGTPVVKQWNSNTTPWKKPALDMPGGLSEPGWTPYQNKNPPAKRVSAPGVARPPVVNQRTREPAQSTPPNIPYEEPAWKNTLRSSSRPNDYVIPTQVINSSLSDAPVEIVTPHEPHVQTFTKKADGNVEYSTSPLPEANENAQVKHLQYNSPMQLYSKDNAQTMLTSQTAGKPGEGTLHLNSTSSDPKEEKNFKNSYVAQMIQQEEWEKQKRAGKSPLRDMPPAVSNNYGRAAAPAPAPAPAPVPQYNTNLTVNQEGACRQSPSMYALESQMGEPLKAPTTNPTGGFSDF